MYEDYLDEIDNIKHRTNFTKLKIRNILLLRNRKDEALKTLCEVCQNCKLEAEDETHFSLRWPSSKCYE